MPNIPCPQHLDCESADAPLAGNLTAEAPDVRKFFKTTYRRDGSVLCESTVSQALVDLCNPPPDGSTVIYSSSPQSNAITCPNGAVITFDASAGLALGFTQADSDAAAAALLSSLISQLCALGPDNPGPGEPCTVECAGGTVTYTPPAGASGDLSACEVAQMLCELNPLVPNTEQTCTQSCPNGESRSFTMPAATFYGLSQVEADALAYQFACLAAVVTCGTPPEPSGTDPDPSPIWWTNSALFCSIPCGDSSGYFHFIAAGLFFRRSLAAANSAAAAYACQQGATQQVCLGALSGSACLGVPFAELIASSGTPTWALIGQLPTGLEMANGLVFGTPSVAGSYTFAVRATLASGSYSQRTYAMIIAGITTTALADGEQDVAYAELLEQSGFTDATWSIVSGALPAGLSLTTDGIIEGTPTGSGDSTFTVRVTGDSGQFCDKELGITIAPASSANPLEWWKMDEGTIGGPRVGSYNSVSLINSGDNPVDGVGGVIGSATRMLWTDVPNTDAIMVTGDSVPLAYNGNGISVSFWLRYGSPTQGSFLLDYRHFNGVTFETKFRVTIDSSGTISLSLLDLVSGASGDIFNIPFTPSGSYQFYEMQYDPGAAKIYLRINNGAVMDLDANVVGAMNNRATNQVDIEAYNGAGISTSGSYSICDLSIYPFKLNSTQSDYLWNSGNGRTWPAVLPP
jgi:hypothetical protein